MATLASATEEISFNYDALRVFYETLQEYISGTIPAPPEFSALVDSLKYTELVTYSNNNKDVAPYLSMGAITDSVYWTASILRERDIIYQTKAAIFNREDIDLTHRFEEISGHYGWLFNTINRRTPDQQGIYG